MNKFKRIKIYLIIILLIILIYLNISSLFEYFKNDLNYSQTLNCKEDGISIVVNFKKFD